MAFDFGREWPFFPDDEKLRIFEPRANVAVLIGHTAMEIGGAKKVDPPLAAILERMPSELSNGSLAAVGTIATLRDGVERVVQNLLTNPHITVLVLCGDDSPVFYPLEGIRCLYAHGVDDGRHVIAEDGAGRAAKVFARDALATLSHGEIACFRRRELAIVDARGPLDPAAFFADVVRRLPELVRPVTTPSWQVLEEIDPYRWRPRTIQVPPGTLERDDELAIACAGEAIVVETPPGCDVRQIVSTGKADGRAQRAVHEVLRRGLLRRAPQWRSRLAAFTLAAERAVLAGEFPREAAMLEWENVSVPGACVTSGAVTARMSPLRLDPTGFFKIRVAYEQGTLAADYHEGGGRHVETLVARDAKDLLAAVVAGTYIGGDEETSDQHLVYLAVQIARADFALRTGLRFDEGQALSTEARKNVDHHLSACAVIAGGSLEETWVRGLTNLRDEGLLTTTQKGRVAEGWCTFFGVADMAAMTIPQAYPASDEHIAHYAAELLAPAPDVRARGDYTYGDRTCHYFFDQIAETGRRLAADPTRVYVNQRWAPEVDVSPAAHHRPCLVFDLWFRYAGRLHTLQIARSHDIYGGLPQNALGVARGWGRALSAATGLPLGDLWFCSISNNFRVGDDADNVRRAIQGGVHAEPHAATIPAPRVITIAHEEIAACALTTPSDGAAGPIAAIHVAQIEERPVPPLDEILAGTPALAERLLRYRGDLDQIATVVARLGNESNRASRERSNSLLLSPRDPVADRAHEATPLLSLQLRRQLGRLHTAAVLIGADAPALVPTLLDLHRHMAAATNIPPGSATFIHVATPVE
jgi:hypothetical protein